MNSGVTSPDDHIVDFANPPVAEVSFAVQFAEPVIQPTATLGDFWPRVKDKYSKIELQPPLPPLEESFEVPAQPTISFNILGGTEASRYWLIDATDTELIQVQPNRFGYNWRKEPPTEIYPRYQELRPRFEEALGTFLETVESLGVHAVPTWCEISYINPIVLVAPGEPRPDLATILSRIAPQELSDLPRPFNSQFAERFQLVRDDGKPYARFHIEAFPMFAADNALGYNLTLVMRGQPKTRDLAGVLDFMDEGRRRIVQTFLDMTTDEMHARWNLK